MSSQNFVDYVKINCKSGNGGAGSMHYYRSKGITHGGPDGGDGGRGGHIILKGNANVRTLIQFKYTKHIKSGHGAGGSGKNATGSSGEDKILQIPLGTIAKDAETGKVLFEITKHGEERILVPGGKGGKGNTFFKSSTNRSPDYAQPGHLGEETWIILELKLMADVGLVGFPNAGKSTLLASITAAKPKIANYAFTTLVPNLGIVEYRDHRSFVMADIPGIIEDAHQGKGIGHRFLRHIERNATLLFLIPSDTDDIKKEYDILLNELVQYNQELLHKPRILAISKSDLIDEELKAMLEDNIPTDIPHVYISGVTNEGIPELKDLLWKNITANLF